MKRNGILVVGTILLALGVGTVMPIVPDWAKVIILLASVSLIALGSGPAYRWLSRFR